MLDAEIQATQDKLKTLEDMKNNDDFSAFSASQMPEASKKPTFLWFVVAFLFGVIGGLIGYFVLKDKLESLRTISSFLALL